MAKYAEQITSLFSSLDKILIESYIKRIDFDQLKIIYAEILPNIIDLDRRKQLQAMLVEREKQICATFEKDIVVESALQSNLRVSDQLQVMFEDITQDILSELNKEKVKEALLQKASNMELFVLKRKLSVMTSNEALELFKIGIDAEIEKREKIPDVDPQILMDEFQEFKKNEGNLQWEAEQWQKLIKHGQEIEAELYTPPPRTYEVVEKRNQVFGLP